MSDTDEAGLVSRIQRRDQAALSALYDRYARPLYAVACRIVGSAAEAEEVVLDAFSQVWRSAGSFDGRRGRVDAWLFTIVRSRALARRGLHRAERAGDATADSARVAGPGPDPAASALYGEPQAIVLKALQDLPHEQREVLELAYFGGLSHTEIAQQTGNQLGTVKTRIRLGLQKLRLALSAAWGAEVP